MIFLTALTLFWHNTKAIYNLETAVTRNMNEKRCETPLYFYTTLIHFVRGSWLVGMGDMVREEWESTLSSCASFLGVDRPLIFRSSVILNLSTTFTLDVAYSSKLSIEFFWGEYFIITTREYDNFYFSTYNSCTSICLFWSFCIKCINSIL